MSYFAIVCPLSLVEPIPGSDHVVRAEAAGHTLVVSRGREAGELGVLFPFEGVIAPSFAAAAGLLAKDPTTGAKVPGGYLDLPARVRALRLRGVRSEGIWLPLDDFCIAATRALGAPVRASDFGPGDQVVDLVRDGRSLRLCEKYLPPQAVQRQAGKRGHRQDDREVATVFPQHYETPQLRSCAGEIPVGARIHASDKLHGTSFRTGHVRIPRPLGPVRRAVNAVARLFGRCAFDPAPLQVVAGSRRVAFIGRRAVDGYYKDEFREQIRAYLGPRLRPGEVVYGEVVGYDCKGRPIMAPQDGSKLQEAKKAFGDAVTYAYGCSPTGVETGGRVLRQRGAKPRYRVFLYRVTQDGVELGPEDVAMRAIELEVEPVPVLGTWIHASASDTLARARALAEGPTGLLPSGLDPSHPREGVVLRATAFGAVAKRDPVTGEVHGVTSPAAGAYKYKAWGFGVLEGYLRDRGVVEADEIDGLDDAGAVAA